MEYLKKAAPQPAAATQEIRDTVSEIIGAVESDGLDAVRRYSERFDGWSPPSFRLSDAEIRASVAAVPDDVARAIERGIRAGRFAVTPGLEITALYRFGSLLAPLLAWQFDRLVKRHDVRYTSSSPSGEHR